MQVAAKKNNQLLPSNLQALKTGPKKLTKKRFWENKEIKKIFGINTKILA